MTEVVEIESVVHTVVVEGDPSPTSVLIEVVEGQVVVDDETVGSTTGSVEVSGGSVETVEIGGEPEVQVIEVGGMDGAPGPPGAPGAPGESPGEIPDMTLIFENGLI